MGTDALPATGSVSIRVAAPPSALWPLISDPGMPARFSGELVEARFAAGDDARVGAVIEGRNDNGSFTWSTRSTVVECTEPSSFEWATGDPDAPTATWTLDVADAGDGSTLTHTVVFHADVEPLGPAIAADPERAHEIVDGRLALVLANMERTVSGIAALSEGADG